MATAILSPWSPPISALPSVRAIKTTSSSSSSRSQQQNKKRDAGNFSHFTQVIRKDVEFIKKGIGKGVDWANEVFRIPKVTKKIDDLIWLRNLEDPKAPPFSAPSWPQHWYPGKNTKGFSNLVFSWVLRSWAFL